MKNNQVATFGGGCFWCTEAIFQMIKGVERVESGYAGGHEDNPTYRSISSGATGHAEVIQVTFDQDQISYTDLVYIFMTSHDPTTLNRQGADRGTQYRSIILSHNTEQRKIATEVIDRIKDQFPAPIVTEIRELEKFFKAEDYHQDYYNQNSSAGYCRVVIDPKIQKIRKAYVDKLK